MVHVVKSNTQIKKDQQRHILMIDVDADIIQDYKKHCLFSAVRSFFELSLILAVFFHELRVKLIRSLALFIHF